ncbi:MAG TPA: kynureninase [Candidatus Dormibacteraeota bacterium]|nr:kynureninase [Candidatus Dormibacteraeota bacterium]
MDRETCLSFDRQDPLAQVREEFALPEQVVYLDGNSLGALPRATVGRLTQVVTEEWGNGLIRSWNSAHWIDAPVRIGDKIAKLIGAQPGEVIIADSTSVNLFKLLAGALELQPERHFILTETANFPTDLYIAQGLVDLLDGSHALRTVERRQLEAAIDGSVAVVMLTHVDYTSGAIHDMRRITAAAHRYGALMLWDLSHSAGAVPVDLNGCGVDLAVGCGYKYLNGGPGAPAYLFVARALQEALRSPLAGWMGHVAPFAFEPEYRPAKGIGRQLAGTPPVISLMALEVAIDLWLRVDQREARRKSMALGDLFIKLVDETCRDLGLEVASPREAPSRGSQVSLRHQEAYPVIRALIDRGVIGDFRTPNLMRFGFAPLYTRYVDVFDAVRCLREVLMSKAWQRPEYRTHLTVT